MSGIRGDKGRNSNACRRFVEFVDFPFLLVDFVDIQREREISLLHGYWFATLLRFSISLRNLFSNFAENGDFALLLSSSHLNLPHFSVLASTHLSDHYAALPYLHEGKSCPLINLALSSFADSTDIFPSRPQTDSHWQNGELTGTLLILLLSSGSACCYRLTELTDNFSFLCTVSTVFLSPRITQVELRITDDTTVSPRLLLHALRRE